MPNPTVDAHALPKMCAAAAAVTRVQSGMIVGLGGGSTAAFALDGLAERLKQGSLERVFGVPCSEKVASLAERLGIPTIDPEEADRVDLTIDGADQVDPHLRLLKGGGGALLREKIVAHATQQEIIVIDESKCVCALGAGFPLPVEVVRFGWRQEERFLRSIGAVPRLRMLDHAPFVTDEGNVVLDCTFGRIEDPEALAERLDARPGIMAHGLFLRLASEVIVGRADGRVDRYVDSTPKPIPNWVRDPTSRQAELQPS